MPGRVVLGPGPFVDRDPTAREPLRVSRAWLVSEFGEDHVFVRVPMSTSRPIYPQADLLVTWIGTVGASTYAVLVLLPLDLDDEDVYQHVVRVIEPRRFRPIDDAELRMVYPVLRSTYLSNPTVALSDLEHYVGRISPLGSTEYYADCVAEQGLARLPLIQRQAFESGELRVAHRSHLGPTKLVLRLQAPTSTGAADDFAVVAMFSHELAHYVIVQPETTVITGGALLRYVLRLVPAALAVLPVDEFERATRAYIDQIEAPRRYFRYNLSTPSERLLDQLDRAVDRTLYPTPIADESERRLPDPVLTYALTNVAAARGESTAEVATALDGEALEIASHVVDDDSLYVTLRGAAERQPLWNAEQRYELTRIFRSRDELFAVLLLDQIGAPPAVVRLAGSDAIVTLHQDELRAVVPDFVLDAFLGSLPATELESILTGLPECRTPPSTTRRLATRPSAADPSSLGQFDPFVRRGRRLRYRLAGGMPFSAYFADDEGGNIDIVRCWYDEGGAVMARLAFADLPTGFGQQDPVIVWCGRVNDHTYVICEYLPMDLDDECVGQFVARVEGPRSLHFLGRDELASVYSGIKAEFERTPVVATERIIELFAPVPLVGSAEYLSSCSAERSIAPMPGRAGDWLPMGLSTLAKTDAIRLVVSSPSPPGGTGEDYTVVATWRDAAERYALLRPVRRGETTAEQANYLVRVATGGCHVPTSEEFNKALATLIAELEGTGRGHWKRNLQLTEADVEALVELLPEWRESHPSTALTDRGLELPDAMVAEEAAQTTDKVQHFGPFVVKRFLGRGALSLVYDAVDPRNAERQVILKVLTPDAMGDPAAVSVFNGQAEVMASLDHPAIPRIYAVGSEGPAHYFAMELIGGRPLSELLNEGQLERERALNILRQIAEALSYCHGRGIFHGDLKPFNVYVDDRDRVAVAGFKMIGPEGRFRGVPPYSAPELLRGDRPDWRVDIFSLGVLAYEMLGGATDTIPGTEPAAEAPTLRNLQDVDPTLEPLVDDVIRAAISDDPAERFESATGMIAALEAALAGDELPKATTRHLAAPGITRPQLPRVGARIGEYILVDVIGEGLYAWVYLGVHDNGRLRKAFKVAKPRDFAGRISTDACGQRLAARRVSVYGACARAWVQSGLFTTVVPDAERLLIQETEWLARSDDPMLVGFEELVDRPGATYARLEYLEGRLLRDTIRCEPVPIAVLLSLARFVERINARGLVHGDLKPENIIVTESGARVIDPGFCGYLPSWDRGPLDEIQVTTPAYYPEGPRNDLKALGIILWEAVCKWHPFEPAEIPGAGRPRLGPRLGSELQRRARARSGEFEGYLGLWRPAQLRPGLPVEIEQTLFRAMGLSLAAVPGGGSEIELGEGFADARALAAALEDWMRRGLLVV